MNGPRRFWKTMVYRCDRCRRAIVFYLEDGCEGPRDGGSEPVQGMAHRRDVPRHRAGVVGPPMPIEEMGQLKMGKQTVPWEKTASGRLVLPVPFVAAGCPTCQPKPPWSMAPRAGVLSHEEWSRDRQFPGLMLTEVPADCGVFLYPPDPREPQACGIPLLPGETSRMGVSR